VRPEEARLHSIGCPCPHCAPPAIARRPASRLQLATGRFVLGCLLTLGALALLAAIGLIPSLKVIIGGMK
jgi:hypothetical protein